MKLLPATLEWIEFAEHDFLTATTISKAARVPYEIVAYHCQQMSEKYLKAILIQNGLAVPFVHDLLKLNTSAQAACPALKALEGICEALTPFGTATRYPGGSMIVGAGHMASVLSWAKAIRQASRGYFELPEIPAE